MIKAAVTKFIKMESFGGILLFVSAIFAMILANSDSTFEFYNSLISLPVSVVVGDFALNKNLLLLVNDGLMAIFFFLIGLEIKREILVGELTSLKKASFSIFAAIGGMVIPALVYVMFNYNTPGGIGWGIPMATDIAFALGVISLLGNRVPTALKIFLLALAIVDDLGAIAVIALYYTESVSANFLMLAGFFLVLFTLARKFLSNNFTISLALGLVVWFCFLKSGVHATIAGVLLALLIPGSKNGKFQLDNYIHSLHPWIAYLIMPIFAFFNAGISFKGMNLAEVFAQPVSVGIILGLFIGKPLGIFLFTFIPVKLKLTKLPLNTNWFQIIAVGFISGIGFTMSLFVSSLAFAQSQLEIYSKMGIVLGSMLSLITGLTILFFSVRKNEG
jgi:NhaA family Na+:H+ antiporter